MKYMAFLIATLLATPLWAESSDWTVFVVDTSGSMTGDRIAMAKQSMIEIIDEIPEGTKVGVLSFHKWEYEPGSVDKLALKNAINGMDTGGGTPLSDYMKQGADQLLFARHRGDRGGVYTLIVVTDGEENDPGKLRLYLSDILSRSIKVKAIGLDMDKDHSLADNPQVEYTNANNPEALSKKLSDYVKAEADFKDTQATEAMFEEINGLPGEIAYAVIQNITEQKNHPIGEEESIEVIDENGETHWVTNELGMDKPAADAGGWGFFTIFGIIAVAVLLFLIIVVMAKSC